MKYGYLEPHDEPPLRTHRRRTGLFVTVVFFGMMMFTVSASGDSPNDVSGSMSGPEPDSTVVGVLRSSSVMVYLADQDQKDTKELYLVGKPVKLNPPFPRGRNVTQYAITPNRTGVVYLADQDTDGVYELYRVDFVAPGRSTKLSDRLVTGGDVIDFEITPDGTGVVYRADQMTNDVNELFYVRFETPRASRRLNPGLTSSVRDVRNFHITPNSTAVVYVANQDINNVDELYLVSLAAPGVSTKLNSPLVAGRGIRRFVITPDSQAAVYLAEQRFESRSREDLYWVAFRIPRITSRIGPPGPLVDSGEHVAPMPWKVLQFDVTPDSSAVVFNGREPVGTVDDLYFARFLRPGLISRLNNRSETGTGKVQDVQEFQIMPDGRSVVYLMVSGESDPLIPRYACNLYQSFFSGDDRRLGGRLLHSGVGGRGESAAFQVTSEGTAVVYASNDSLDDTPDVTFLRVELDSFERSTWVGNVTSGYFVSSFAITSDSSAVVYLQKWHDPLDRRFANELYRVQFAMPDAKTKLNGPLVAGGDVRSFQIK